MDLPLLPVPSPEGGPLCQATLGGRDDDKSLCGRFREFCYHGNVLG